MGTVVSKCNGKGGETNGLYFPTAENNSGTIDHCLLSSRFALLHIPALVELLHFLIGAFNLGLILCHVDVLILRKNWKLFIRFYLE